MTDLENITQAIHDGHARAAKLTPEQRSDIARKAAVARWGKDANE